MQRILWPNFKNAYLERSPFFVQIITRNIAIFVRHLWHTS
jgi:hypothetical protein